jgi:hypothetical protein
MQAAAKPLAQMFCLRAGDDSRRKVDDLVCWHFQTGGQCNSSGVCSKLHLKHAGMPVCASHLSFLLGSRKKECYVQGSAKKEGYVQHAEERSHPEIGDLRSVVQQSCKVSDFEYIEEETPNVEQWIVGHTSAARKFEGKTRNANKRGAMDYLVRAMQEGKGSSCTNPHLCAFVASPFLSVFLEDLYFRQSFNSMSGKALRKELTESWAIGEMVTRVLKKLPFIDPEREDGALSTKKTAPVGGNEATLVEGAESSSAEGGGLVVIDCCSGKGMGSVLLSLMFPRARVYMLDNDTKMKLPHLNRYC